MVVSAGAVDSDIAVRDGGRSVRGQLQGFRTGRRLKVGAGYPSRTKSGERSG